MSQDLKQVAVDALKSVESASLETKPMDEAIALVLEMVLKPVNEKGEIMEIVKQNNSAFDLKKFEKLDSKGIVLETLSTLINILEDCKYSDKSFIEEIKSVYHSVK